MAWSSGGTKIAIPSWVFAGATFHQDRFFPGVWSIGEEDYTNQATILIDLQAGSVQFRSLMVDELDLNSFPVGWIDAEALYWHALPDEYRYIYGYDWRLLPERAKPVGLRGAAT